MKSIDTWDTLGLRTLVSQFESEPRESQKDDDIAPNMSLYANGWDG